MLTLQEAAERGVKSGHLKREIRQALRAVAIRSSVLDAAVISPDGLVVAARDRQSLGLSRKDHPGVAEALERGDQLSVRGDAPGGDPENFHYVDAVQVGPRDYALETTYDNETYEDRLDGVRRALFVTSALTLLIGGLVFYLVGGRALIRSHRFALMRATRDGLTDLFNQRAFAHDLERIVRNSNELGESLSLAVIDLDDFNGINDRLGRAEGDNRLMRTGEILRQQRPADRVYRIGSDEFAILLAQADTEAARILAGRLVAALRAEGIEASIGVSFLRDDMAPDVFRSEAVAALAESRRQGGNMYSHFDDLRGEINVTSAHQLDAVRRMIDERGLTTAFQPIWDIQERRLLGFEALTRPNPEYGLSGPAEAFDIAEQLGQVRALDRVCLAEAIRAAAELPEDALIFLNMSPQTLDTSSADDGWLLSQAARSGIPVERIVIEVTERYGGRTALVVEHLRGLKEQGFRIALDDVGTGNSGLEMLGLIEADFVKVDRSIIAAAEHDRQARAVLMAIAAYASQTGAFVIAEGIEDTVILDFLETLNEETFSATQLVRGAQGYGLGRPSSGYRGEVPWPA